jgi:hypothetical protein
MIEKFEELFRNNYSSHEKLICSIPLSCCSCTDISVFSFDEIKTDFYLTLGIPESRMLKSVDAIYFSPKTEELYLIEMKGFGKAGSASITECKRFIKKHFKPFNLPNKIIDSIFIINTIMGYFDIDKDCYQYFLDQNGIKIKSILLSNFSNQEILDLTLLSLHKQKISLTKRIVGEIGILNSDTFSRHFKSIA